MPPSRIRGQSAIEFLILFGFAFFIFVVFLLAVETDISDEIKKERNLEINEVAIGAQREIYLAIEASDGYIREFEVPGKIANLNYEISIEDGLLYLRTSGENFATAVPVTNVTGEIKKGTNVIRNVGGKIFLNN